MSSVTRFLLDRSSESRLEGPAPAWNELEQAFRCAARTPDHALLRPWRYLIVEGEKRAALGDLFAQACGPDASDKEREKARNAPFRAPMVIVGIASPEVHPKVPEVEQVLSAGSGLMLLSLALNDAGYGTMWRTGSVAYSSVVRFGLGLTQAESIVGFLYTGSVAMEKPAVPRPEPGEFVAWWPGGE